MFRILTLVLALAAYGAYTLLHNVTGTHAAKPEVASAAEAASTFSFDSAAGLVGSATEFATGGALQPIPNEGCSDSALPPEQVMALLDKLPDTQRAALATVLNASSTVWTVQLYHGDQGVGLCLPTQGKLLRLPGTTSLPALPDAGDVTSTLSAVTDALKAHQ